MTTEDEKEYRPRRRGRFFLIPAGVLIGLGVGLLAGYPGSGVLIGLGLGFLGSGLMNPARRATGDTAAPVQARRPRWISVFLGIILIVMGIGIVWAPLDRWPYIIATLLILLGIWFLARDFLTRS
jgi:hypothetical protein